MREQGEEPVVFVQASKSCLGENSINSPKFLLELSFRRRAPVLSEGKSCSGEEVSLKRTL